MKYILYLFFFPSILLTITGCTPTDNLSQTQDPPGATRINRESLSTEKPLITTEINTTIQSYTGTYRSPK